MKRYTRLLAPALLLALLAGEPQAATYVSGFVPNWDQPYNYGPPGTGPGMRPMMPPFTWDAWCAPTAGANLLGHWEDVLSRSVADGAVAPLEGAASWGNVAWHDRKGHQNRPAPGPPVGITDLGWFMDTNNLGDSTFFNGAHAGTFVRDTHAGLKSLLDLVLPGFTTGTQGNGFGLGTAPGGSGAAISHPNAAAAFADIKSEIDAGRTVLVSWSHWNVAPSATTIAPVPLATDESLHGVTFFDWGGHVNGDIWGNNEDWSIPDQDIKETLGHVTTVVGYVLAGAPEDPGDPVGIGGPSDWVIVHDNAPGTVRNVSVPLNSTRFSFWVGNTNASFVGIAPVPMGSAGVLVGLAVALAVIGLAARRRA